MMALPMWSVVIPTRNRRGELSECLRRLAPDAQAMDASEYEVIVTDDGDYDTTDAWLCVDAPWARHVRGPCRGPAANRNAGAQAARGVWIVFADDDIVPSNEWLAAYAAAAGGHASVLEGRTTCNAGLRSPMAYAPENNAPGALWSCNFAIRRTAFEAVGGFDEQFPFPHMEDADLRERLRAAGHAIGWVANAVVDHPPRRRLAGSRMGAYREAEVRFLYKHGAPRPVRWALLRNLILSRLVNIRVRAKGIDSLVAFASLVAEVWHVLWRIAAWERASAREFPVRRA